MLSRSAAVAAEPLLAADLSHCVFGPFYESARRNQAFKGRGGLPPLPFSRLFACSLAHGGHAQVRLDGAIALGEELSCLFIANRGEDDHLIAFLPVYRRRNARIV